jgi:hypothetical protein
MRQVAILSKAADLVIGSRIDRTSAENEVRMANRISMVVFPLLVLSGSVVWLLGTNVPRTTATTEPRTTEPRTTPSLAAPAGALPRHQVSVERPADQRPRETTGAEIRPADPDHVVAVVGRDYTGSRPTDRPTEMSSAAAPEADARPSGTEFEYTAGRGDTVTRLAEAFLGGGTKAHRNAIINANPSLGVDPDHLLVGEVYRIVAPNGLSAVVPGVAVKSLPTSMFQPDADDVLVDGAGRNLRYTARAGDTVTNLARALLGSDKKANRDAILNSNPSLKAHPDRIIAGQTYWIPAPVAPGSRTE